MSRLLSFVAKQFAGPYHIQSNRDGVDDTYDIVSQVTQKLVASIRYWDSWESDRRRAEDMATIVSIALDHFFGERTKNSSLAEKQKAIFKQEFPGPYCVKSVPSPFPAYEIIDSTTQAIFHVEYGSLASSAKLRTYLIATALNRLLSHKR